jgi:hypothetical protein
LTSQARTKLDNGWYRWSVDPDLIHANALGLAHGLTVHEVSSDYSRNPTVFSRESRKNAPYLSVRLGREVDRQPLPSAPSELKLIADAPNDGLLLSIRAPARGLSYVISVGSRELPRVATPYLSPGEVQRIPLGALELKPGEDVTVSVRTMARSGALSRVAEVKGRVPRLAGLVFPDVAPLRRAKTRVEGIDVVPVLDRFFADGSLIGGGQAKHRSLNAVFDGARITLQGARGEVVGFQVLLRGEGRVHPVCRIEGLRVDLQRAVAVKTPRSMAHDPLVPIGGFELQRDRDTVLVGDVFIPFDTTSEEYVGALSIGDGRTLPIHIAVRGFTLPRTASFLCEMNSYGLPDRVDQFYALQGIAYDHRVHVNVLHYGHRSAAAGARQCNMDMRKADGQRMAERRYNAIEPGATSTYWGDFIEVFGSFLSGSCFARGHRGAIPAPGFYLTFHESWPLNVRPYFNGDLDAYAAFAGRPEYAATFVAVLKDFVRVAKREGWTKTGFQLYLNNKGSLKEVTKAPWILDEPTAYWDYRALAYYGDLTRRAKGKRCPIDVQYRIDISRPEFARGELDGKSDLWVVNGGAFDRYQAMVMDRQRRTGETIWTYGTSSHVHESSRRIQAWVLEAYLSGATGVVPWQTVNKNGEAMKVGDQLGLFIFDGPKAIRHTMRLKAYRRAEQDIEYLELLRRQRGWTRRQLREFVSHYVRLRGETKTKSAADAGTRSFGRLSPESFRRLREATATLIR